MNEMRAHAQTPAGIGAEIFAQVSRDFPASTIFQGTKITDICEERSLAPAVLGLELLEDDRLIQRLVRNANGAHIAGEVHKFETDDPIDPVDEATVRGIVTSDFTYAHMMGSVSSGDRAGFLALYPAFRATAKLIGASQAEDPFRRIASSLLNKHAATLPDAPTMTQSEGGLTVIFLPK